MSARFKSLLISAMYSFFIGLYILSLIQRGNTCSYVMFRKHYTVKQFIRNAVIISK